MMHEYQKTFRSETNFPAVIATILLLIKKKKITTNKALWQKSKNKYPIIIHIKVKREREAHSYKI